VACENGGAGEPGFNSKERGFEVCGDGWGFGEHAPETLLSGKGDGGGRVELVLATSISFLAGFWRSWRLDGEECEVLVLLGAELAWI